MDLAWPLRCSIKQSFLLYIMFCLPTYLWFASPHPLPDLQTHTTPGKNADPGCAWCEPCSGPSVGSGQNTPCDIRGLLSRCQKLTPAYHPLKSILASGISSLKGERQGLSQLANQAAGWPRHEFPPARHRLLPSVLQSLAKGAAHAVPHTASPLPCSHAGRSHPDR